MLYSFIIRLWEHKSSVSSFWWMLESCWIMWNHWIREKLTLSLPSVSYRGHGHIFFLQSSQFNRVNCNIGNTGSVGRTVKIYKVTWSIVGAYTIPFCVSTCDIKTLRSMNKEVKSWMRLFLGKTKHKNCSALPFLGQPICFLDYETWYVKKNFVFLAMLYYCNMWFGY